MKQAVYCISGLGADEKIFNRLELEEVELRFIPWLRPEKKESIEAYAKRMASSINGKNPVILGVSFGGIIGIEIARQMMVRKLIIVSSIKSVAELPGWMQVSGKLKLNKFLPIRSYKFMEKLDNGRLGVSNTEEREMVRSYRRSADFVYLEWAIDRILNWKNTWVPPNLVHIHGSGDKIFPIKRIKADYVLDGATHLMIYNRAKEVSRYITSELQQ